MLDLKAIHEANLAKILGSIGVSVTYNGINTYGYIHREPIDALPLGSRQYTVLENALTLTIVSESLGQIFNRTPIVVDGKNYTIDHFIVLSNGSETKLWLVGA